MWLKPSDRIQLDSIALAMTMMPEALFVILARATAREGRSRLRPWRLHFWCGTRVGESAKR